jgi:dipeptidyl aminopeptidase/acylaminoacyl peptidase
MRNKVLRGSLLVAAAVCAAAVHSSPAAATNPGANGRIVFVGLAGGLYSVNPDGSGLKRLGPRWDYNSNLPNWSPDGSRIIFNHWQDDPKGTFVMRGDGSGVTKMPAGGAGAWSPDGAKIAFAGGGIFVMDADGSDVTQLNDNGAWPTWSPDGARIAFIGAVGGQNGVWTIDPDGGNPTLIHTDTTFIDMLDWSPDGSRIIFGRGDGVTVPNQIWSMQFDGSDVKQLTTSGRNGSAAWSPDGTKIVFGSRRANGLWLMNADGTGQTHVKKLGMEFVAPSWQPVNLTLGSSRDTVTWGDSLKLTAHLLPFAESANQTVSLYALPAGGSKALIASGTVNSSGNFSITTRPKKNTRFIAQWTGDAQHLGGGVGEVKVGVHTLVEGELRGFDGRRGRYHLYHYTQSCPNHHRHCPVYAVHVTPNRAGERIVVILQLHYGGDWHQALRVTPRLDARSSLIEKFIYASPDIIGYPTRVGALIAANKELLRGKSRWAYFKVTS